MLSANSSVTAGLYTLTVQVKDEEETEAETAVKINVVASSTAALSAGGYVSPLVVKDDARNDDLGLSETAC